MTLDQVCDHAFTLPRSNIARRSGRGDELTAEIRQALDEFAEPMTEEFEVTILLAQRKAKKRWFWQRAGVSVSK